MVGALGLVEQIPVVRDSIITQQKWPWLLQMFHWRPSCKEHKGAFQLRGSASESIAGWGGGGDECHSVFYIRLSHLVANQYLPMRRFIPEGQESVRHLTVQLKCQRVSIGMSACH